MTFSLRDGFSYLWKPDLFLFLMEGWVVFDSKGVVVDGPRCNLLTAHAQHIFIMSDYSHYLMGCLFSKDQYTAKDTNKQDETAKNKLPKDKGQLSLPHGK